MFFFFFFFYFFFFFFFVFVSVVFVFVLVVVVVVVRCPVFFFGLDRPVVIRQSTFLRRSSSLFSRESVARPS